MEEIDMPIPIRKVSETEHAIPGASLNPGGAFSPLQRMFLGLDGDRPASAQQVVRIRPISRVDVRDSELLHKIWLANDGKRTADQNDNMTVPEEVTDYDVIRLKTAGLVVGRGRKVSFTAEGDKIVRKKILEAPSTFDLDRTREKYDPDVVRRDPESREKREANGRC